jgi:hypothetical protein
MLKTVRNRDIDFNALLSKVGQSLVAARVGGVMTSAIIRGVHPRFLYAASRCAEIPSPPDSASCDHAPV